MRKMCRFVRFLFFVCLLALALPGRAGNIALILSEPGGVYQEFSATLEEALAGSAWKIGSTVEADALLAVDSQAELIVAVGSEALRQALLRNDQLPIIATLLPRQNYDRALAESRRRSGKTTAIHLDQPPARQAAFLRQLLPGLKRIGMLFSNETRHQAAPYRLALANAGLSLHSEDSDSDNTLLPALNSLFKRSDALLAIPDGTIYRRNNIKAVLITAFRYQRPVIGYSPAFVSAGALAALHSTVGQMARQTAEQIVERGANLAPPTGPSQFAIAINHNVALALGLNIPDEATIRQAMLADRDNR
jgi:putative tryptophan/tyrosine transport system substrate-binding protein